MEEPDDRFKSLLNEGYDPEQAEEITFREAEFAYYSATKGQECPN